MFFGLQAITGFNGGHLAISPESNSARIWGWLPSEPSDGSDHLCPAIPSEIYPNFLFRGNSVSNGKSLSVAGPETRLTS